MSLLRSRRRFFAEPRSRSASGGHTTKAATVTLPVWDQEAVRRQDAAMTQLNKTLQKRYPNIKINWLPAGDAQAGRVRPDPPDVIEVNSPSSMGPVVKASCC